jgi:hypothetical protein
LKFQGSITSSSGPKSIEVENWHGHYELSNQCVRSQMVHSHSQAELAISKQICIVIYNNTHILWFLCVYIYIGLSISNPTNKHVCSHPNPLNSRGREHFHDWPEALASLCHGQWMLNGLMFSLKCSAAIYFLLVVLCVFFQWAGFAFSSSTVYSCTHGLVEANLMEENCFSLAKRTDVTLAMHIAINQLSRYRTRWNPEIHIFLGFEAIMLCNCMNIYIG